MNTLQATLEAILFAAGDAVPIGRLAQSAGVTPDAIEAALDALSDQYDFEQRGIMLVRMEDKAQLCSRPAFADAVRRAVESRKPPQLSPAAIVVVTIVAYGQPVARASIVWPKKD